MNENENVQEQAPQAAAPTAQYVTDRNGVRHLIQTDVELNGMKNVETFSWEQLEDQGFLISDEVLKTKSKNKVPFLLILAVDDNGNGLGRPVPAYFSKKLRPKYQNQSTIDLKSVDIRLMETTEDKVSTLPNGAKVTTKAGDRFYLIGDKANSKFKSYKAS